MDKAKDLEGHIKSKDSAIVLFYASWCPFSQSFLPVFEDYAKKHPNDCISVIIDDSPEICEKYSIEYYPTVIFFRKGKIQRRLDAKPGVGIEKKQFEKFCR